MNAADVAIVVPTVGRPSLRRLLAALEASARAHPVPVIVVDDRRVAAPPLSLTTSRLPVQLLCSGGRGPAAARNVGWRSTTARWICFLDDDVIPSADWLASLYADLDAAEAAGALGCQGRLQVPAPIGRRPSDDERRTCRLSTAQWITADLAYRRDALVAVGGFDERFPRAYREDSDLALRISECGGRIDRGVRGSTHPIAEDPGWWGSVRAQIGNTDDALMRRKHGRGWRAAAGEGRGRLPGHLVTVVAALSMLPALLFRRRQIGRFAAVIWSVLTAEFWLRRFVAGPHTAAQGARLLLSSIAIPPVAVARRLHGEWMFRHIRRDPPLAVLFDRDDTIIEDGPYLNDPAGVRPMPGAAVALDRLRRRGLLLGVVSNQSGVAKGLITHEQLAAVNAEVDVSLGPFDVWQVCPHDADDRCRCRKPLPAMVFAAAAALGVPTSRCVLIGDTGADVDAALAAHAEAVLVPTERTLSKEVAAAHRQARVASSLAEAVTMVLRDCS